MNANIVISDNCATTGGVYSDGAVELIGTHKGLLITQYTVANQNSQKYRNYIFNGRVLTENLPSNMAGLPLDIATRSLAAWLY